MSTTTTYYNLVKPDVTEAVDIDVINDNMDIVDTQLKALDTRLDAIELNGGWTALPSFAANWSGTLSYKTRNGLTRLRGTAVRASGTGTAITGASAIPAGNRPANTHSQTIFSGAVALVTPRITINNVGAISINNSDFNNGDVLTFDNVSYFADA